MNAFLRNILSIKYLNYWIILSIDLLVSVIATAASIGAYALLIDNVFSRGVVLSAISLSFIGSVVSFYLLRTYRAVIRHSNLRDVWRLFVAGLVKVAIVGGVFIYAYPTDYKLIFSCSVFDVVLTFFTLMLLRVLMIVTYDLIKNYVANSVNQVLIYGVSPLSSSIVSRIETSGIYRLKGFFIFGERYKSYTISGYKVFYFNNENDFGYVVKKYGIGSIIFPDYSSAVSEKNRLISYCLKYKVKILLLPPVNEYAGGNIVKGGIREIKIEDLLGRDEITINMDNVNTTFKGKRILVTGAAGSIGSELCRQLAMIGCESIALYDAAETPMHNIRLELESHFPNDTFIPIVGDVRNKRRLKSVFNTYKPQIIFHAAAYKHVPLMEENPCEAILVNVVGSRNVAEIAVECQVEHVIMISTDKAVNPTNVMGASKRIAEMYVQSLGCAIQEDEVHSHTKFTTTRFGNVLGSNGSVIPFFRAQIEAGGPVTVTHPDITRFFMTIPEACRLVMEAATLGRGNEIFVFDMGESVKIDDLARRMIELAGYVPNKDIEIKYTGLRPGEKLYEETLSDEENTLETPNKKIRIANVRHLSYEQMKAEIENLTDLAQNVEIDRMVMLMKQLVPEYKSRNSQFEQFDHVQEVG